MSSTCPNLFNYATSELSQDAFVAWLIEWSKVEYKTYDIELHNIGKMFLEKLLEKAISFDNQSIFNIKKIYVKKQYKNIDVLIVINDEYGLVIEDKVKTTEHGNQLGKYWDIVKEDNLIPLGVYLKTGNEPCRKKIDVKKDNKVIGVFKTFYRNEFLNVLNKCNTNNNIFVDYRECLSNQEKEYQSYKVGTVESWGWSAWEGFFEYLYITFSHKNEKSGYGYVHNARGGFLGCWWNFMHFEENDKVSLYLQFEVSKEVDGEKTFMVPKLVVKTCIGKDDVAIKKQWYNKIDKELGNSKLFRCSPNRRDGETSSRLHVRFFCNNSDMYNNNNKFLFSQWEAVKKCNYVELYEIAKLATDALMDTF